MITNKIILELLNKRGISGDKEIEEFLSPKPLRTYDPFLLLNMEEGVDLILDTINSKEKICIYGDYDADGVTSVSILMEVLSTLTDNIFYHIPSRFDEGYGLNKDAIKEIKDKGAKLLITVDCGIVSSNEVEYAKEIGLKVIITDHHRPGDMIPNCIVINPKQPNCNYPFKELAGCGIAFKLAQGLQRKTSMDKSIINRVLDLVALGTIGDVVPLVDENRTIVKYGMREIKAGRRISLDSLISEILKDTSTISSEDISYNIVPHINAAGRIAHASIGVELFTSKDLVKISQEIEKLVFFNDKRKRMQNDAYKKCIEIYENNYLDKLFPIIYMPGAHEGITGIVAGKMKEYCNKPIAIVTDNDENYKGTSRGTDYLDIHEILSQCSHMFEKFGGHKGACGFTIAKDKLGDLTDKIEDIMTQYYIPSKEESRYFDMTLVGEDISLELVKEIEKLEPFGSANERPIFKIDHCTLKSQFTIGSEGQHIKIRVSMPGLDNLECVYFNYPEEQKAILDREQSFSMIGQLEINRWNGREILQFLIREII